MSSIDSLNQGQGEIVIIPLSSFRNLPGHWSFPKYILLAPPPGPWEWGGGGGGTAPENFQGCTGRGTAPPRNLWWTQYKQVTSVKCAENAVILKWLKWFFFLSARWAAHPPPPLEMRTCFFVSFFFPCCLSEPQSRNCSQGPAPSPPPPPPSGGHQDLKSGGARRGAYDWLWGGKHVRVRARRFFWIAEVRFFWAKHVRGAHIASA